jgi:cellulose synthase/poly-beta-1,6-N-acetylglucosamine synthase-like glycosyltransferase
VLVPAYREPEVIGKVIAAIGALDYPADRLDVRLAARGRRRGDDRRSAGHHRGQAGQRRPRTLGRADGRKPKACNFGLQGAPGEFVTVFDAEDRPEPLQLRRAVVALRRLGDGYACVQARLGYFNSRQNLITRWFSIEYANWFGLLLPGLVSVGHRSARRHQQPLPRRVAARPRRVGRLQRHRDADLGIRLARLGYAVGVLDSLTEEEANSDFVNWVKQRSRWYKGYLQTWLVHMRSPRAVHRDLGWRG